MCGLDRRSVRVWDVVDDDPDEPTWPAVRCDLVRCAGTRPAARSSTVGGTRRACATAAPGAIATDEPRATNYYRPLYRSGETRRVVAAEHTGLLDRASARGPREGVQGRHRARRPERLTATPTLEMGIDIGDLSAVMLTSVPRNPATYIQRVGRAGRATGNSLITTFVRTDTHGLYYLADPRR